MAALTKGFSWFSSTVSKQAANLNTTYIQPGIKNLNETDFAAQARAAALQAGNVVQQGAKGVNDQFNRFVDPEAPGSTGAAGPRRSVEPEQKDFWDSFGQAPAGPPKEKKDFWDDFAAAGEARAGQQQPKGPTSIGTSAMKTNAAAGGAGAKKEDDGWGAW
jgi:ADP-ribosylation factor GTPase-activating protein 1